MQIILQNNPNSIDLACKFLLQGRVISFATDTVYGLAVDATNEKAVQLLYSLKKRDPKKPIAVFLKNIAAAEEIFDFDETAKKIATKLLPGSLTIVLKQNAKAENKIAKNLNYNTENFLGFRIIDNDFVKELMLKFNGILAVTSANPSNQDPAKTASEVQNYFLNSDLSLIVDGGKTNAENVSTVIKIFDNKLTILRQGLISESVIKKVSES